MRKWSITVPLTAAALVIAGTVPMAAQDNTEVSVWSWRIEDQPAYEEMFAAFTAENPGITVKFEPTVDTEYETRLTTALQAQRGPDIAQLKPYGELQPIIDGGYLEPLDGVVPGLADFYPTALDGARSVADGKVYGVPYALPNMGVYYNTQIFADNGIAVPTTYEEFVAACEKLKAAGITPIAAGGANGTAWALEIMIGVVGPDTYGGDEFWNAIESGAANFTDPRWVAALQRVQDLYPTCLPGSRVSTTPRPPRCSSTVTPRCSWAGRGRTAASRSRTPTSSSASSPSRPTRPGSRPSPRPSRTAPMDSSRARRTATPH
ncbi:MAG: extracellular solute-binding protein [Chloroflexota bacterium]